MYLVGIHVFHTTQGTSDITLTMVTDVEGVCQYVLDMVGLTTVSHDGVMLCTRDNMSDSVVRSLLAYRYAISELLRISENLISWKSRILRFSYSGYFSEFFQNSVLMRFLSPGALWQWFFVNNVVHFWKWLLFLSKRQKTTKNTEKACFLTYQLTT